MTIHITGSKKSSNEKQTSNVKQEKIKDKRQLLVQTCEARPFIKIHGKGLEFDSERDMKAKNPELNRKR